MVADGASDALQVTLRQNRTTKGKCENVLFSVSTGGEGEEKRMREYLMYIIRVRLFTIRLEAQERTSQPRYATTPGDEATGKRKETATDAEKDDEHENVRGGEGGRDDPPNTKKKADRKKKASPKTLARTRTRQTQKKGTTQKGSRPKEGKGEPR